MKLVTKINEKMTEGGKNGNKSVAEWKGDCFKQIVRENATHTPCFSASAKNKKKSSIIFGGYHNLNFFSP